MAAKPYDREGAAFAIVESVLGAQVQLHDTDGRQAAVDGIIVYSDGRRAALEVTTLTSQESAQLESLLANDNFEWRFDNLGWAWSATISTSADLRTLKARLPTFLGWCESHRVTDPNVAAYIVGLPGSASHRAWLQQSGVRVYGHPESIRPGTVYLLPEGKGGSVGDMEMVTRWLSEELVAHRTMRKVKKLERSGFQETPLFLIVDDTGAPFAGFYAMAFGDAVPSADPTAPDTLYAIWLAPRWSPRVLLWTRDDGWSMHQPYDNPEQLTGPPAGG